MNRAVEIAKLMQGNEAVAEGALAAGVRFFAGYPITPSTEIAEIMSERLPRMGGKFIQMEDEIASIAAIIGASLAGVKTITATSGPGFSLMQENLGFAAMAEVPIVVVNVQRSGPSTGMPTAPAQGDVMQSRWGTHGDHPVIVLSPSSVREAYNLAFKSVNLAEKYRVPVILLMDEVIGHLREKVVLSALTELEVVNRSEPNVDPADYLPYRANQNGVPTLANFGQGYRYHVTGLVHDEKGAPTNNPVVAEGLIKRLNNKNTFNIDDISMDSSKNMEDAELVVIAYGSVARSASQAVKEARAMGIKAGLYRPAVLWPFPEQKVKALTERANVIIVPEMNLGQYRLEVERLAGGRTRVIGINRVHGELITPEEILTALREVY
ncbi:2-oxoglutarate ferredoxin oxidoreductase subunit alpha [Desulfotomaculum arcticum]|uniref:2-oxoglutarate ferredoxin oxidoreductase subunit alpha n=1 Tax=Desulfotruncus arcticus DSM 17038 TaxID=1121424 RepID=A0A1I2PZK0_9FIRM|nr:2-oxoacid:acceptor oxidoreductase subunit alpha [Desulfotruncus arcticus]SFG21695.1 2-oxoglutarate ferredoxin oxidoreductase subunit alpha [Desulfotomaculum arcticum] [Desulfotruncus arcticus DSM 17038]